MLKQKPIHPKWWILYVLMISALGLFVLDARLATSQSTHRLIELGIVLLLYGSIYLWLHANRTAMMREDTEQHKTVARELYTMHFIEPQNPISHSSMKQNYYEPASDTSDHRA